MVFDPNAILDPSQVIDKRNKITPPNVGGGGLKGQGMTEQERRTAFYLNNVQAAQQWEQETGVPASVWLAWMASETNFGNAGSYFGVKGVGDAGSDTYYTREVVNGGDIYINDDFAKYSSAEAALNALFSEVLSLGIYDDAMSKLAAGDWRGFLQGINQAGYATDPGWANNVISMAGDVEGYVGYNPDLGTSGGTAGGVVGGGAASSSVADSVGATLSEIGPNGRTLEEVQGTQYLSDDERRWYLTRIGKTDVLTEAGLQPWGNAGGVVGPVAASGAVGAAAGAAGGGSAGTQLSATPDQIQSMFTPTGTLTPLPDPDLRTNGDYVGAEDAIATAAQDNPEYLNGLYQQVQQLYQSVEQQVRGFVDTANAGDISGARAFTMIGSLTGKYDLSDNTRGIAEQGGLYNALSEVDGQVNSLLAAARILQSRNGGDGSYNTYGPGEEQLRSMISGLEDMSKSVGQWGGEVTSIHDQLTSVRSEFLGVMAQIADVLESGYNAKPPAYIALSDEDKQVVQRLFPDLYTYVEGLPDEPPPEGTLTPTSGNKVGALTPIPNLTPLGPGFDRASLPELVGEFKTPNYPYEKGIQIYSAIDASPESLLNLQIGQIEGFLPEGSKVLSFNQDGYLQLQTLAKSGELGGPLVFSPEYLASIENPETLDQYQGAIGDVLRGMKAEVDKRQQQKEEYFANQTGFEYIGNDFVEPPKPGTMEWLNLVNEYNRLKSLTAVGSMQSNEVKANANRKLGAIAGTVGTGLRLYGQEYTNVYEQNQQSTSGTGYGARASDDDIMKGIRSAQDEGVGRARLLG